jgi:hypothetical protein
MSDLNYIVSLGTGGGGPAEFGDVATVAQGTAPATLPAAGNVGLISRVYGGWTLPVIVDSAGNEVIVGPDRLNYPSFRVGFASGPTIFHDGLPGLQTAGTLSIVAPSAVSIPRDAYPRMQYVATGVGAGAGFSTATAPGNPSTGNPFIRRNGFLIEAMFCMAGTHAVGQTAAIGMSQAWTTGTPTTFNNIWQVGFETGDALTDGIYVARRGAGAVQRESLGSTNFPRNGTTVYRAFFGARADDTSRVFLTLINVNTGAVIERSATTDIPGLDTALNFQIAHNQQSSGVAANMQIYYVQGFWETPV